MKGGEGKVLEYANMRHPPKKYKKLTTRYTPDNIGGALVRTSWVKHILPQRLVLLHLYLTRVRSSTRLFPSILPCLLLYFHLFHILSISSLIILIQLFFDYPLPADFHLQLFHPPSRLFRHDFSFKHVQSISIHILSFSELCSLLLYYPLYIFLVLNTFFFKNIYKLYLYN